MAEAIRIECPSCKKALEIPRELEEFSCMYCGARMKLSELLRPTEGQLEAEDYLRAHLPETVTRYPDYYRRITKKEFIPAFTAYEQENSDILAHLDVAAQPGTDAMQRICGELLNSLDAYMAADKRWKHKTSRSQVLFETKLVLAIFLCPLVRKLGLASAEEFCTELNRLWLERYPKQVWYPGDYEVLLAGFKKRRWCFITTATCRHEGKPDDCAELTAFRAFRDGWLSESVGGQELIDTYYNIAPGIVACIDYCDAPAERYEEIRRKWLAPCYHAIREGRPEDCRAIYTDMVHTLCEKYEQ